MEALQVQMLGNFAIELDGSRIDDSSSRSQKPWLLLAYLIYFHNRTIPQEELYRLCWGDEESKDDPANALRVILHRARTALGKLGVVGGHDLIVRTKDGVRWNGEFPVVLDAEQFENLCISGLETEGDEARLAHFQQALALYRGEFLGKHSSEPWVTSTALHYHNLYIKVVQETLQILESQKQHEQAVTLCRQALAAEPYSEALYYHLLRNLLDLGRQKEAVAAYEEMRDVFITNFDILPSEEVRALYYEAIRKVNDRAILMDMLHSQLQEENSPAGALLCDFDFFRVIYHSTARLIARSGAAVHMGLLSVTPKDDEHPLSKRSLERVMGNLRDQVQGNLRRGDVLTQCSVSQLAVLLPLANYENSCMVCERVIKTYFHKYPHAPVKLSYVVQEVTPSA